MSSYRPTVIIVRDRPSSGGGIYNYYTSIEQYLTAKVILCDSGRPYRFYGKTTRFGSSLLRITPLRLLWDGMVLVYKMIRHRPDVLHVNPCLDPPSYRSMRRDAVNILIGRLFRTPVLVFWRGWENEYSGRPEFPGGNDSAMCRVYKSGTIQVVLAERFKEDLQRWGFRDPIFSETTVVSDDCLAKGPRDVETTTTTDLLFLSRIEELKGVFELLEAFQILKERDSRYTLTFAGDGPEKEVLQARAAELVLNDVSFPGFVTGSEKVDYYRRGGIFCFLSYTEGMPNAVLEAMGMGLPIVSSDAGGLRDILENDRTGLIVHPVKGAPARRKYDATKVADAIEILALDRDRYFRISAHNTGYAKERFAAPEVARRLDGLYAKVLELA